MSHWEAKGFWMRDNIHWPRPVHPLFVSYGLIPIEVGSARAYEEWSMPSLKYAYLVLHGYVFHRIEPIGGDAPPIMERFPLLFHLWRINPLLRSRLKIYPVPVLPGNRKHILISKGKEPFLRP